MAEQSHYILSVVQPSIRLTLGVYESHRPHQSDVHHSGDTMVIKTQHLIYNGVCTRGIPLHVCIVSEPWRYKIQIESRFNLQWNPLSIILWCVGGSGAGQYILSSTQQLALVINYWAPGCPYGKQYWPCAGRLYCQGNSDTARRLYCHGTESLHKT